MKNNLYPPLRNVQEYSIIDSIHSIKTTSEDCAYISVDKSSLYLQKRGRLYIVKTVVPLIRVGKNAVLHLHKGPPYGYNINIASESDRGGYIWTGNYLYRLSRASLLRLQEQEAKHLLFPTL